MISSENETKRDLLHPLSAITWTLGLQEWLELVRNRAVSVLFEETIT
jgi:hypothetical protein